MSLIYLKAIQGQEPHINHLSIPECTTGLTIHSFRKDTFIHSRYFREHLRCGGHSRYPTCLNVVKVLWTWTNIYLKERTCFKASITCWALSTQKIKWKCLSSKACLGRTDNIELRGILGNVCIYTFKRYCSASLNYIFCSYTFLCCVTHWGYALVIPYSLTHLLAMTQLHV